MNGLALQTQICGFIPRGEFIRLKVVSLGYVSIKGTIRTPFDDE